jgi:hypothetical protein
MLSLEALVTPAAPLLKSTHQMKFAGSGEDAKKDMVAVPLVPSA